ncbi:MAG: hypothetical protein QXD05_00100 [Candidatus Pacearchaeota archaeon]
MNASTISYPILRIQQTSIDNILGIFPIRPKDITNNINILDEELAINLDLQQVKEKKQDEEVKKLRSDLAEKDFLKKKINNIIKIISFSELDENWDGYGAEKIDNNVLKRVLELIIHKELKYQPEVFPTGRGTIQIEYEKPNRDYLEVEIFKDKYILYKEENNISEEKEVININEIVDLINEFQS